MDVREMWIRTDDDGPGLPATYVVEGPSVTVRRSAMSMPSEVTPLIVLRGSYSAA